MWCDAFCVFSFLWCKTNSGARAILIIFISSILVVRGFLIKQVGRQRGLSPRRGASPLHPHYRSTSPVFGRLTLSDMQDNMTPIHTYTHARKHDLPQPKPPCCAPQARQFSRVLCSRWWLPPLVSPPHPIPYPAPTPIYKGCTEPPPSEAYYTAHTPMGSSLRPLLLLDDFDGGSPVPTKRTKAGHTRKGKRRCRSPMPPVPVSPVLQRPVLIINTSYSLPTPPTMPRPHYVFHPKRGGAPLLATQRWPPFFTTSSPAPPHSTPSFHPPIPPHPRSPALPPLRAWAPAAAGPAAGPAAAPRRRRA